MIFLGKYSFSTYLVLFICLRLGWFRAWIFKKKIATIFVFLVQLCALGIGDLSEVEGVAIS